ncbi:TPA: hypothetical protein LTB99_004449 [Escherichia coli]|nr:hypothetical protein [Escherichia coli]
MHSQLRERIRLMRARLDNRQGWTDAINNAVQKGTAHDVLEPKGYVTEHISQEEETYAAERLDKIRRQNRIKAELQAVLDEK